MTIIEYRITQDLLQQLLVGLLRGIRRGRVVVARTHDHGDERHVRAVRDLSREGDVVMCPICGGPDLFRRRNFNQRAWILVILAGAILGQGSL